MKFISSTPIIIGMFGLAANPLDQFEILDLIYISIPLFGYIKLSITNLSFYLLLATSLVIGLIGLKATPLALGTHSGHGPALLPNKWTIFSESLYLSILSMIRAQIGVRGEIYLPFIFTLFNLILIVNLCGMIPYSFSPTAHFSLALSLSIALLLGLTILSALRHGLHFFSFFIPAGTPLGLVPLIVLIETISYVARAFSLGIRLAANLMAGHTLLKIISLFSFKFIIGSSLGLILSFIPLTLIFLLIGLELGVAALQAYVFTILTCSYLNDAINLH